MYDILPFMKRWKNKLNVPLLEYHIFHLLSLREMYGRSIIQNAQKVISDNIKVSTIYAILKRGVDEELIALAYVDDEETITRGTARKYYTLTDHGLLLYKEMRKYMQASVLLKEDLK